MPTFFTASKTLSSRWFRKQTVHITGWTKHISVVSEPQLSLLSLCGNLSLDIFMAGINRLEARGSPVYAYYEKNGRCIYFLINCILKG
jgi:hypothetical protein